MTRLLLDTHVLIWWRVDPEKLSSSAVNQIASAEVVFVSAASAWEAGIKASLGKLELPGPFEAGVVSSGFQKMSVTFSHAEAAAALPLHHRDPFDRMLVAQAQSEGLVLVTRDRQIDPYKIEIIWA